MLKKDLVVLSAGYNGNLGDQAIAYSMARQCLDHGLHPFFVDYNDIHERNAADANLPVLMFGGELGDLFHFTALKKQQPRPLRAAIGGISISNTFISSQDPELLSYLKQIQAFFVRDKSVAKNSRHSLCLTNIQHAPDIVFSLAATPTKATSRKAQGYPAVPKTIGINVQAFFLQMSKDGSFSPIGTSPYGSAEQTAKAEHGYRQALRALIQHYQQQGYVVFNYSFCMQDTLYFKKYFSDLRCETLEFYWNFEKLIQSLGRCCLFVASRYHAHIASMIAGLPTISIMVGAKNTGLLLDMDISLAAHPVNRDTFLNPRDGVEALLSLQPFRVPSQTLKPQNLPLTAFERL